MSNYGVDEDVWAAAKEEARQLLIDCARRRKMVTYSELVTKIDALELQARDPRLFHLLGEISTDEARAGRGMLSALVIHKHGDQQPGTGFYELACSLGLDSGDKMKVWVDQFKKVWSVWSKETARG